jgi:hypothetical protein
MYVCIEIYMYVYIYVYELKAQELSRGLTAIGNNIMYMDIIIHLYACI